MAKLLIPSLQHMDQFAFLMADLLREYNFPPLFLDGPLGSGKTTFACKLASFFPGGKNAETGSPTFTLCNYYPTKPPILHCDLYRCESNLPEEIFEFTEQKKGQLIVEWGKFFMETLPERLDIGFDMVNDARSLEITSQGDESFSLAYALVPFWEIIAGPDAVIAR